MYQNFVSKAARNVHLVCIPTKTNGYMARNGNNRFRNAQVTYTVPSAVARQQRPAVTGWIIIRQFNLSFSFVLVSKVSV